MRAASEPVADMKEVRATLVGAGLLLSYVSLVLMTGRVEIAQLVGLFATYVTGSFALWFMVGMVGAIAQLCWRARKSGRGSFLADYVTTALQASATEAGVGPVSPTQLLKPELRFPLPTQCAHET